MTNLYLFRGTFDLGSMQLAAGKDYGDYNFTIQSVVPDTNIYINDNLFVFVHPSDDVDGGQLQTVPGFSDGNLQSRKRMVCRHLKGLMEQLPHRDSIAGYRKVTNGWYAEPVKDAAGGIIQDALQNNHSKTFYMDADCQRFQCGRRHVSTEN